MIPANETYYPNHQPVSKHFIPEDALKHTHTSFLAGIVVACYLVIAGKIETHHDVQNVQTDESWYDSHPAV